MFNTRIDRLEKFFGLLPAPHLNMSAKLVRIFLALFFRPGSLSQAMTHENSYKTPTLFLTIISILKKTIHDLLTPLVALVKLIFKPIQRFIALFNTLLDWLFVKYQPGILLIKTTKTVQKKKWLFGFLLIIFTLLFLFIAQTNMPPYGQWLFLLVCYLASQFFIRLPKNMANLCLMLLTLLMLARYAFWRLSGSLDLLPGMETVLGYLLLSAEAYTWLIIILGFVQVSWPLKRKPIPLRESPTKWPTVDVFIPTYNESLQVVKATIYASQSMDWPSDKLTVYLLDDGNREDFRAFAEQVGIEYIARKDNAHAKAGNINNALAQTDGEFIAIFDCDHIPCRSFLQTTMGTLIEHPNIALVQTPHHFFSADPFEKNYDVFRQIPNEGELFYGLIQDGNDYWDATFFCGSCAVIRRKPLVEIGGIAIETVTEDAHTSLKLHSKGYSSAYLKIPQAAGLATSTLADHISQRIRWARGMAQIFRIDNPFFKKGLSVFQKICYANAMLHFFYGIPRIIFLLMPGAYLFFEYYVINAEASDIISYAVPPIVLASFTTSFIQGKYRKSFWAEIYETVLSWYIVLPTTLAMINPKLGKFNVTRKEKYQGASYFDLSIAKPYLIFSAISFLAFGVGIFRFFIWNTHEAGTVLMNLMWCTVSLILLGAAIAVATEKEQKNTDNRVKMTIPATLYLPNGHTLSCYTNYYSNEGLELLISDTTHLKSDSQAYVGLHRANRDFLFPVKLSTPQEGHVKATFNGLSSDQEAKLVQCTFGRADAWLNWQEEKLNDSPLSGLWDVIQKGKLGYARLWQHIKLNAINRFNRLYFSQRKSSKYDF